MTVCDSDAGHPPPAARSHQLPRRLERSVAFSQGQVNSTCAIDFYNVEFPAPIKIRYHCLATLMGSCKKVQQRRLKSPAPIAKVSGQTVSPERCDVKPSVSVKVPCH